MIKFHMIFKRQFKIVEGYVLVSLGYHNKIPYAGGLKKPEIDFFPAVPEAGKSKTKV